MPSAWTVARLAVDRERREPALVAPRRRIVKCVDLAPMTPLTVRESWHVAEHPCRGPVAALGEGHVVGDRDPAPAGARGAVAEPDSLTPDELERQEAQRAVGVTGHEPLCAAALQVPAADDAVHAEPSRRPVLLSHRECVLAGGGDDGGDHGVAKADRGAAERGENRRPARRAARPAVRRAPPGGVLPRVAGRASLRAHEVLQARLAGAGHGARRRKRRERARSRPAGEEDRHEREPGDQGRSGPRAPAAHGAAPPARDQAGPWQPHKSRM